MTGQNRIQHDSDGLGHAVQHVLSRRSEGLQLTWRSTNPRYRIREAERHLRKLADLRRSVPKIGISARISRLNPADINSHPFRSAAPNPNWSAENLLNA